MTNKQTEDIFGKLKELDRRVKKLEKESEEKNKPPVIPPPVIKTKEGRMFDVT
jgi:hypothetical protein